MKTIKYFSAKWCGPCRTFKPVMEEIASEGYSVQFIDIDESYSLQEEYKVTSVPTIVIEENEIEVDRFIGALPKKQVMQKLIDKNISRRDVIIK